MATCVYAGTFDPFTYGHHSVVKQACKIFSHVRILIAVNDVKHPLLDSNERLKVVDSYIRDIPNASVRFASGYVVKYAEEIGASFLVRGIRNLTDATAELEMSELNLRLAPTIQTVLIPTDPVLSGISSTAVKKQIGTCATYEDMKHLLTYEAYLFTQTKMRKT